MAFNIENNAEVQGYQDLVINTVIPQNDSNEKVLNAYPTYYEYGQSTFAPNDGINQPTGAKLTDNMSGAVTFARPFLSAALNDTAYSSFDLSKITDEEDASIKVAMYVDAKTTIAGKPITGWQTDEVSHTEGILKLIFKEGGIFNYTVTVAPTVDSLLSDKKPVVSVDGKYSDYGILKNGIKLVSDKPHRISIFWAKDNVQIIDILPFA